MTKLGVAVIGTGQWGKNHARVYKELPSTELVAVCDVNAERAKAMAQQYGVKAYSDSTEMLKDKDIQAVNVCTWSTILSSGSYEGTKRRQTCACRETHGNQPRTGTTTC